MGVWGGGKTSQTDLEIYINPVLEIFRKAHLWSYESGTSLNLFFS